MASLPHDSVAPAEALPWVRTPCVLSTPLSKIAGCNVWLKLENLQPSGSFKSRGIGNLMRLAAARAPPGADIRFYSSSSGNAGLACACAAISLGRPATIVVPESTKPMMVAKLRALRAEVVQTGRNWLEADTHMRENLLDHDAHGVYVPPFDHPDIWSGAATLVDEVAEQLPGVDVDAVACAVGGGGLLNGIVQGIERQQAQGRWRGTAGGVTVLAVETQGADSLNASVRAGRHVKLPAITSLAASLGAVRVSDRTWEYARRSLGNSQTEGKGKNGVVANGHVGNGVETNGHVGSGVETNGHANVTAKSTPRITSVVVSDADAARALIRFADDARMVVEIACGAALASVYGSGNGHGRETGGLRAWLGGDASDEEWAEKNVVVVVCGGSAVSLAMIDEYRQMFGI